MSPEPRDSLLVLVVVRFEDEDDDENEYDRAPHRIYPQLPIRVTSLQSTFS